MNVPTALYAYYHFISPDFLIFASLVDLISDINTDEKNIIQVASSGKC